MIEFDEDDALAEAELAAWNKRNAELRDQLEVWEFTTEGAHSSSSLTLVGLVGKVNAEPFLEKPPGTVLLRGFETTDEVDEPLSVRTHRTRLFSFAYRVRPWNEHLTCDGMWAEYRDLRGSPLYEPADFSGLPTELVPPA